MAKEATVKEAFCGYIETIEDAYLVIDAARQNRLPRVMQRLNDADKKTIRSGSVFVLNEKECGVRRWTDGRIWSPSRISGRDCALDAD
jgi:hypothetical protein